MCSEHSDRNFDVPTEKNCGKTNRRSGRFRKKCQVELF